MQSAIFESLALYKETEGLSLAELSTKCSVSKYQIKRMLDGDFDGSLKTLLDVMTAVGLVPILSFKERSEII